MNSINLTGRICRSPEIKTTDSGKNVLTNSIAVKGFGEKTTFLNFTAWQGNADYLSRFVKKGNMIAISGRLESRDYVDKDGNNKTVYEVVCSSVENLTPRDQNTDQTDYSKPQGVSNGEFKEIEDNSDLPF